MLIGKVVMIPSGLRIYDVDGSCVDLTAMDALDLMIQIVQHRLPLLEMVRTQRGADEATVEAHKIDHALLRDRRGKK